MPTPRDHALSIGGVESAKLSGNEGSGPPPSERQKDTANDIPLRERQMFDKAPPKEPIKPFR